MVQLPTQVARYEQALVNYYRDGVGLLSDVYSMEEVMLRSGVHPITINELHKMIAYTYSQVPNLSSIKVVSDGV